MDQSEFSARLEEMEREVDGAASTNSGLKVVATTGNRLDKLVSKIDGGIYSHVEIVQL